MNYDETLNELREMARVADLGIKTFCLVYLNCETVPEAVTKIQQANGGTP